MVTSPSLTGDGNPRLLGMSVDSVMQREDHGESSIHIFYYYCLLLRSRKRKDTPNKFSKNIRVSSSKVRVGIKRSSWFYTESLILEFGY